MLMIEFEDAMKMRNERDYWVEDMDKNINICKIKPVDVEDGIEMIDKEELTHKHFMKLGAEELAKCNIKTALMRKLIT